MSKSILKNRVLFFLILLFSIASNAQVNMYRDWRINNIIGIRDLDEYSMVKLEANSRWGILLTLNLDGSFICRNLPQCGNDVFTNALGDFILIDEFHIRFVLKETSFTSYEKENNSESKVNRDLGIFYIYNDKDSNSIKLIKSNGVLQDDKDSMLYKQMLDSFDKEWKSYDYAWINTNSDQPEQIVKDCVDQKKDIDLSNCKVVFSRKQGYGEVFLLREKEEYHYAVYNSYDKKVSLAYPNKTKS